MIEPQGLPYIYLTLGVIAGVRVFLRMRGDQVSLFDPETRSAAIEMMTGEMICAFIVMTFFF